MLATGGLVATFVAGAAYASAPSNAVFSPGSSAPNALSTWTVGLTTSSTGALAPSDTISVVLNSNFAIATGQTVVFTGFGSCPGATDSVAGNVATVSLGAGCALGNSSSGTLSIPGITNPGVGTYPNTSFSVATSKDSTALNSASNIVIGTPATNASTTSLTVTPNPTPPNSKVSVTATVAPTTATGTVTFFDNGSAIVGCTGVAVATATATCATTYPATGNTSYVAVYSGSTAVAASTSAPLVPVAQIQTRTYLMLRKSSDLWGKETRQRITVNVTGIYGTYPISGQVKAMAGNQTLCVITLSGNTGTCTLSAHQLSVHTYRIYGVYTGAAAYTSSQSDNHLYRIIRG